MLDTARWQARADAHAARADALTAGHRARRSRHEKHAVEDFLFEYYPATPAQLRRWHPGAGVTLAPGPDGPAPQGSWRWYRTADDGTVDLVGVCACGIFSAGSRPASCSPASWC